MKRKNTPYLTSFYDYVCDCSEYGKTISIKLADGPKQTLNEIVDGRDFVFMVLSYSYYDMMNLMLFCACINDEY